MEEGVTQAARLRVDRHLVADSADEVIEGGGVLILHVVYENLQLLLWIVRL